MTIPKTLFQFLCALKLNNNRDWFAANKETYQFHQEFMKKFVQSLKEEMERHDSIEKAKLYRIYRDMRFSKDKTPYKTHFGGWFRRASSKRRGGYYFHIEPNNTTIAGGFWRPNGADLKRIRAEIAANDEELRNILQMPDFLSYFGKLEGESVKTTPRGYPVTHPSIDLIKMKQFVVRRSFSDDEVLHGSFFEEVTTTFLKMRPFFDFMSEVLTTDANGLPVE